MPVYHSTITPKSSICRFGICSLNTKTKGPAPLGDIVDESINLFRANVWFKQFDIHSDADRTMIYNILYITEVLKAAAKSKNKNDLQKDLTNLALAKFDIPGDAKFPLNAMYGKPSNNQEADQLRGYILQLRQEIGTRLLEKIIDPATGAPSKWWLAFAKKKFMEKSL